MESEPQDQYVVYSLTGCHNCVLVKEAFSRSNIEYDEIVLNKDLAIERFQEIYPNKLCCPFCTINGKPIGGLLETVSFLLKQGLLSKSDK